MMDNMEEAKKIFIGISSEEEKSDFLNRARQKIGYSPNTAMVDIFRFLQSDFHSIKK